MIPKIIHYCWFGGGEKPKLAKKCIASWKKYCPDYEIIEWNEDNFDINTNEYTKWCYENKKFAFLSDYVRLLVVYRHGGIYFDIDVELVKNPDLLLKNQAFFAFECSEYVNTGVGFGAEAENIAVNQMIDEYSTLLDGKHGVIGCPKLNTEALVKLGLKRDGTYQEFPWGTVYPKEYFNPYESTTGVLNKTENTVSVHWFSASWMPWRKRLRTAIGKPIHRLMKGY